MRSVRLPEPFTFFVDRSLGAQSVATALREAGEKVAVHDDHFAINTPDTEWLKAVGQKRWVVLTKDARIRTNAIERDALLVASVAAFMLGRGDANAKSMAAAFVTALPRMKKALRRCDTPFIATVSIEGEVAVVFDAGRRLERPRRVK